MIQDLFDIAASRLALLRRVPIATYRLQFHHRFKFSDARSIVSYLFELGISDCYASPYFVARKGSLHGYDILDHRRINPEIGTEEEFREFSEELGRWGMGQILDIVPNHMSIDGEENLWWMDVLENGPSSVYSDFFDIDWHPVKVELENKVLLPILGDQYGRVLENQELSLRFEEGAFFIDYHDKKLPLDPVSYKSVLKFRIEDFEKEAGKDHPDLQELLSIATALEHLPPRTTKEREKVLERQREKEVIKRRLWNLYHGSDRVRSFVEGNVLAFNGEKNHPRSFDGLDELLNDQSYRLSHWRVATEEINYRRFFDINELAAIRVENPEVFREVHKLAFALIREGKITGLRVDHPDGLYNPVEYLYRLQKSAFLQLCLRLSSAPADEASLEEEIGRRYDQEMFENPSSPLRTPFYIVGEKILTKSERIPEDWPIFGTIGYVFLNPVNGIFVDMEGGKAFDEIYSRFIRSKERCQDLVYEKKKLIMQTSMASEVNMLGHTLNRLSERDRHTRDFTLNSLRTAIVEVIASFPVYRTYVNSCGVTERDLRYIEQAVARAKRENPALNATVFDFLQDVLLLKYPEDIGDTDKMNRLDFVMRFQQVTGPVMAKGFEDTVFYIYNRLVSLNEVGGNPERFGTSIDAFHGQNIEGAKSWPHGLVATSTHDTKRSEDVRARLNVLSELPEEWRHCLVRWSRFNRRKKSAVDGQWIPDRNEEYLLYQTLLGAWPIGQTAAKEDELFKKRIREYMLKVVREAKVNSSWISPNLPYEEALSKFIDAILSPSQSNSFLKDFETLQTKLAYFGMFNSLSQTLLKIASPGTPDFFQGTELWDFSLVDPDNRRPVDFDLRKRSLKTLKERMEKSERVDLARGLIGEWRDGSIKLYVVFRSLHYRRENHRLFMEGRYTPLICHGDLKEHLCAFARQNEEKVVLAVVPRFLTRLVRGIDELPLGEEVWRDSSIVIPKEISSHRFINIFTGEEIQGVHREEERLLPLHQVFSNFPVALLEGL